MKTVTLSLPSGTCVYDILIEDGLFARAAGIIKSLIKGTKATVITDSNVAPLYLDAFCKSMTVCGFSACSYTFKAGEQSKHISTILEIYEFLAENQITRGDVVIALGGGVTGDMAGFAAATYLRGVSFVQIPTTILAAMDSSVGGKTGFDTQFGKNQIGAFYQPKAVLIDPLLFQTLPKQVFNDGMAEVIKHGLIANPAILAMLEDKSTPMADIIEESIRVKAGVVEQDEKDTGIRGILNFGHTFGHAAEKLENYSGITHGQAVAAGMVYAAKVGESLGATPEGTSGRIASIVSSYGLPTEFHHSGDELFAAAISDKKNMSGEIGVIILSEIGKAIIRPTAVAELGEIMHRVHTNN